MRKFHWSTGLFIIGYHLLLLILLPIYLLSDMPSSAMLLVSFILLYVSGVSVTAGYHRCYSHLAYKLNPVVESILLFFGTMATQGSALTWAFNHRQHHAFVDTDDDPYSIKKGFWYAHILWIFQKQKEIDNKVVADLLRSPLLRFQHKYYAVLMLLTNVLVTLFFGWYFNDYFGAFLFTWLVRLFFLHHFTWFINSLAHTWGARDFCEELSAVDNYLIALVTFGEGYHNYHHTFAHDYRNGIRWFHFDPTKWFIWTLSKLGLAYRLRKNQKHIIEKKIILNLKQLYLDHIHTASSDTKKAWEERITALTEAMLAKLNQLKELRENYSHIKKEGKKEHLHELSHQIKSIRKDLKKAYKNFSLYKREIFTDSMSYTQSN